MQLTQPTEPQFHRGIWAWDAANETWVQLQIDTTTGALHVAVESAVLPTGAALEVTQAALLWFATDLYNQIRRRYGYDDTVLETVTHTVTVQGTNDLDFTAVPADTIHVITSISVMASTTNPTLVNLYIRSGGADYGLATHQLATASFLYTLQGWWVLKPTDAIRAAFTTCNNGDVLTAHITGFSMDITGAKTPYPPLPPAPPIP